MSTLTKFKGIIDNPSLYVLTRNGLVDQLLGNFILLLEGNGYSLTPSEQIAVTNLVTAIRSNDMVSDIRMIWPFIGDSEHLSAAKVPLFSDKMFDFYDNFNSFDIVDGKIHGLTKTPAISSLKLSDVADTNFISAAFAIKKPLTTSANSMEMFRFGDSAGKGYYMAAHKLNLNYRSSTKGVINYNFSNSNSSPNDAGMCYYMSCAKDNGSTGLYTKGDKKGNDTSHASSGSGSSSYPFDVSFSSSDLNASLSEKTYPSGYSLSCIVVLKERIGSDKAKTLLDIMNQFMVDLGRTETT